MVKKSSNSRSSVGFNFFYCKIEFTNGSIFFKAKLMILKHWGLKGLTRAQNGSPIGVHKKTIGILSTQLLVNGTGSNWDKLYSEKLGKSLVYGAQLQTIFLNAKSI